MNIKVINNQGADTGREVSLSDNIFAIAPNDHVIYLAVKQYLANQRQGTAKSLERSEISGSTRKLHKQKGTGGSRKGSIKNPLFHGGPRVFGPKPRDYSFKINKKVSELARKSAFAYKAKDNSIFVLEDVNFDQPKTKQFLELLNNLKLNNKKVLFLTSENNNNFLLSGRNIPKTYINLASNVNTYELLNAQVLVLFESAVQKIENLFNN